MPAGHFSRFVPREWRLFAPECGRDRILNRQLQSEPRTGRMRQALSHQAYALLSKYQVTLSGECFAAA